MRNLLKIKSTTLNVLNKDILSRSNDIRLTRLVLEELNLPTDLRKLEEIPTNVLESVRRCRQKLQVENPMLYAPRTKKRREKMKEEYRDIYE